LLASPGGFCGWYGNGGLGYLFLRAEGCILGFMLKPPCTKRAKRHESIFTNTVAIRLAQNKGRSRSEWLQYFLKRSRQKMPDQPRQVDAKFKFGLLYAT
jgi:hypothetical protein